MGVTLNGILRCANEAEAEIVRSFVAEHIRLTRAEPGCIFFEVSATEDPLIWHVAEEFTDPAAFEAHQARTAASEWAEKTKSIAREYTLDGMP